MSETPPRPPAARFPIGLERVQAQAHAQSGRPLNTGQEVLRPQRHLQQASQASQHAARQVGPAGLGMDSAAVRRRMVERLRADGVRNEAVLNAFAQVERHRFVDTALAGQAYEDTSLPIGLSQTISKPSVVAHMLALLCEGAAAREQGHLGRVLEIGTGCGYQAALLALLGRSVVSVERLLALHEKARGHLEVFRQGLDLRLVHGDGRQGHAPRAPYQSIIAAAGGDSLPPAWLEQLAVGGRMVAPMWDARQGVQLLMVVDRTATGLQRQAHDAVHFVPLKFGTE